MKVSTQSFKFLLTEESPCQGTALQLTTNGFALGGVFGKRLVRN